VYDVLCAADMFLLPGLKRFCANAMAKFLTVNDVVTVLRTARLFNLPRLEDQCAEFIAKNLEPVST
jgi:ankyrin repeat/BTB/POZ domain-containing protein 1